jgi:hypothetical protein
MVDICRVKASDDQCWATHNNTTLPMLTELCSRTCRHLNTSTSKPLGQCVNAATKLNRAWLAQRNKATFVKGTVVGIIAWYQAIPHKRRTFYYKVFYVACHPSL